MEENKVSIIIPIFNVVEYMDMAIETACNQSYRNIEIILVDDGSTDGSSEKCDLWAQRDSRIIVIHKPNGGLSDARNAGLDTASGVYIYFLDGDDYIYPELVDTAVLYLDRGDDMVVFQNHILNPDGTIQSRFLQEGLYCVNNESDRKKLYIDTIYKRIMGWEAWNRVYRRDIIEKYHIRFEDNHKIFAEDLFFVLCYYLHVNRIESIDDKLYVYRLRAGSIMDKEKSRLNAGRLNELGKAVKQYFIRVNASEEMMKLLPAIHFLVIYCNTIGYKNENHLNANRFRLQLLANMQDITFFRGMMREFSGKTRVWKEYFDRIDALHLRKLACFWNSGSKIGYALRTLQVISYLRARKVKKTVVCCFAHFHSRRIVFIGSEDYGNIGDAMISVAGTNFLKEEFPDFKIIEIPKRAYWSEKPFLLKSIRKNDIIVLNGGGNFGGKYYDSHRVKQDVVRTWKANPKYIFPQTIYYENDETDLINTDKAVFSSENNVMVFTREKMSYEFAKKTFTCRVELVPDIVLRMNASKENKRSKRAVMILRSDSERLLSNDQQRALIRDVKNAGLEVVFEDFQIINDGTDISVRTETIEKRLDLMRESEVVVTDRLHGMISAAITGTPCIVLGNYNYKVRGLYDWISYLPYVRFAEDVKQVPLLLIAVISNKSNNYDNAEILQHFHRMAELINETL